MNFCTLPDEYLHKLFSFLKHILHIFIYSCTLFFIVLIYLLNVLCLNVYIYNVLSYFPSLPSALLTQTHCLFLSQVPEFPCVCCHKVPVLQHQLKGGRQSRSLKERNTVEAASLPVTSTCQKPSVTYPWISTILLAVPESSSPALRWSPMHFYPSVSTELTLAQHHIDHDRGRDCYPIEKYMDYPLPTWEGTGLTLYTCSTSTDTNTHAYMLKHNTCTFSTFKQKKICNYKY